MFYSHFVLARKGPLGTIWIAAHLEGKLRKNQVTETSISASVDSILFPDVPLALRLSGHLLLGVVRIYSRKVNYLHHDCSEALVKIKHAFLNSGVNLPPEASKVPFHSITLPETFELDELEYSFKWDKIHASAGEFADHHISARDLITLQEQRQEEARRPIFDLDERFPGNSDPYSLLYESNEGHAHEELPASSPKISLEQEIGALPLEEDVLPPLPVDEQMELDREGVLNEERSASSLMHSKLLAFEGMLHSSQAVTKQNGESSLFAFHSMQDIPDIEKLRAAPESKEPEPLLMELDEEQVPSSGTLKTPVINGSALDDFGPHEVEVTPVLNETPSLSRPSPMVSAGEYGRYTGNEDLLGEILGAKTPAFKVASSSGAAPEPAQQKRRGRKRKPVFDDKPILSSKAMKKQLAGASDLLRERRKLPLTDFGACRMKDNYNDRRFEMPSFPGLSAPIRDLYSRFTRLPSKGKGSSSSMDGIHSPVNQDKVRASEIEFPVADIDPLDGAKGALYSHHSSPQHVQCIPISNAERSSMDIQESQKQNIDGATDGQQEKGASDSGLGQEPQEAWDTLPNPLACFGEGADMLHHPDALATQASRNEDNVVMPLFSKPLTCTPSQSLDASTHGDSVLPKLDFLEACRDNNSYLAESRLEDPFVDETDTTSYGMGRPQNSYGWSVRTKFVAKYLKSVFEEKEAMAGSQPVQVSLDSLLKGRTRKEAARLYFETLVLKSRDYIDVEQKTSFAEIMLSSTPLLRKDAL